MQSFNFTFKYLPPISTFVNSLEKFWLWSLYNPPKENNLAFYLAEYRNSLLNGFEIKEKVVNYEIMRNMKFVY